jgi:hypothetical protein
MDGLKESKQAVGAATLVAVNDLAPPTILAQASRLNFSTRLFNLLVTNVPGPQVPLYVLGRRLRDMFPTAFLPEDHALAVAIMSYDGNLDYGLLGDYDAMPDIDVVADGIERSLAALLTAARGGSAPPRTRRAQPDGRSATARAPDVEGPAPIVPKDRSRTHGPAADMRAKRARGARRSRSQPSNP